MPLSCRYSECTDSQNTDLGKGRSSSDSKECAFFLEAWKYALQLFLPTVCLSPPPPPPPNVCISNHTLTRIYSILSLLTM